MVDHLHRDLNIQASSGYKKVTSLFAYSIQNQYIPGGCIEITDIHDLFFSF